MSIQEILGTDTIKDSREVINANFAFLDGVEKRIYKTADQTVNNSSTFVDDNHLTFIVGANEVWAFKMLIIFDQASSATDTRLKYRLKRPSGSSLIGHSAWFQDPIGDDAFVAQIVKQGGGGGGKRSDVVDGVVVNGATPGSVTLEWAQNTEGDGEITVFSGSYIIAHRLA